MWLQHQLTVRHSDGDFGSSSSSSAVGSHGLRYHEGGSTTGSTGSRSSEDGAGHQAKGAGQALGGDSVASQASATPKKLENGDGQQELQDTAMSPLRVGGIP
jgi:hypothetical protein